MHRILLVTWDSLSPRRQEKNKTNQTPLALLIKAIHQIVNLQVLFSRQSCFHSSSGAYIYCNMLDSAAQPFLSQLTVSDSAKLITVTVLEINAFKCVDFKIILHQALIDLLH